MGTGCLTRTGYLLLASLFVFFRGGAFSFAQTPDSVPAKIVVADDKAYPPLLFLDSQGNPRGITWHLESVEQRTGIPVEFRLMDGTPLEAVRRGRPTPWEGFFTRPNANLYSISPRQSFKSRRAFFPRTNFGN
jgi:hypothetical protein